MKALRDGRIRRGARLRGARLARFAVGRPTAVENFRSPNTATSTRRLTWASSSNGGHAGPPLFRRIATGETSGVVALEIDIRPAGNGFDSLGKSGLFSISRVRPRTLPKVAVRCCSAGLAISSKPVPASLRPISTSAGMVAHCFYRRGPAAVGILTLDPTHRYRPCPKGCGSSNPLRSPYRRREHNLGLNACRATLRPGHPPAKPARHRRGVAPHGVRRSLARAQAEKNAMPSCARRERGGPGDAWSTTTSRC